MPNTSTIFFHHPQAALTENAIRQDDALANVDNMQFLFELTQSVMEIKHSEKVSSTSTPFSHHPRPANTDALSDIRGGNTLLAGLTSGGSLHLTCALLTRPPPAPPPRRRKQRRISRRPRTS